MNTPSQPNTGKKTSVRRLVVGILLVALLGWVLLTVLVVKLSRRLWSSTGQGSGAAVTVSPETTYVVQPLREDGYVDYLAALNERSRRGVTPENNAAVLLWQAIGPAEILAVCGQDAQKDCDWFFRELGIARLPDEGDYFVFLDDYAERLSTDVPVGQDREPDHANPDEKVEEDPHGSDWHTVLREQFDQARKGPWSEQELPELAAWLEQNERPLRLVVEASQRERFYQPLIPPDQPPPVLNALRPGLYRNGEMCRALAARAMLRLDEGKIDEAWQDLLACHRLARLVGQGPTLIEALTATAIENTACSGDVAVAHHDGLTSEQARHFQADLAKLGFLPGMVDRLSTAERFAFLDSVCAMARDGPAAMDDSGEQDRWMSSPLAKRMMNLAFDWDEMLLMGNALYDRIEEIGRITERPERAKALADLEEEIDQEAEQLTKPQSLARSLVSKSPRRAVSEATGQVLIALLVPAVSTAFSAEDRAVMTLQMTQVALALAAYRKDTGEYPDELPQLVPQYLDEVPKDVFTGGRLRYERTGEHYLLYSVGPNREDDQGRTYDSEPSGDDIVIGTAAEKP